MSVISGSLGAVMGSDAQTESAQMGANAQIAAAMAQQVQQANAISAQEKLFNQSRADFEPYRQTGLAALPKLQDAVLNGNYNINESPAAKYALQKGNTALMRGLGARGLAGSGGAAVKLGDLSSSIAANDWKDQYSRLLDMVKIGTGASAATGVSAPNYNAGGANFANLGNSLSNMYNQSGAAKASLYSGLGGLSSNTLSQGMQLYQTGKGLGWWGGAGAGAGAAASSAGSGAAAGSSFSVSPAITEYGSYTLM